MPDIDSYPGCYAVTWVEKHNDTSFNYCSRAIHENDGEENDN